MQEITNPSIEIIKFVIHEVIVFKEVCGNFVKVITRFVFLIVYYHCGCSAKITYELESFDVSLTFQAISDDTAFLMTLKALPYLTVVVPKSSKGL